MTGEITSRAATKTVDAADKTAAKTSETTSKATTKTGETAEQQPQPEPKNVIDIEKIVHRIAGENIEVHTKIVQQSPEIAAGVDTGGAGDQGIMIGYATAETPELLPLEVVLARRLNQFIFEKFPYDGKTQVTLAPDGKISSVVASFQSAPSDDLQKLVSDWLTAQGFLKNRSIVYLYKHVLDHPEKYAALFEDEQFTNGEQPAKAEITKAAKPENVKNVKPTKTAESKIAKAAPEKSIRVYLNPAGDWSQGGFDADTGLTGRKLIVDNYGPRIAIGGGCYSGKDATKVDRSAAYMARKIAVDYLKKRKAHEVLVRLAYAIGYAEPLEKTVIIDGAPEEIIGYDLTPRGIIEYLDLKRPVYEATARWGHYGEGFPWDE